MAEPRRVTDEEILSGFTSLQEAMLAGFARIDAQLLDLRSAIAASEQRTLRRFDRLEQRFDSVEQRFGSLERQLDSVEQRFGSLERRFDSGRQLGSRQSRL
jgi:predicted  nucleic acid-binding Zn-ribbon protein